MDTAFLAKRLAQLRMQKGVSARDMSFSLGQSESYINKIENQRTLPSMQAFFDICDYLHIAPKDFLDDGNTHPEQMIKLITDLKKLDEQSLLHISELVDGLVHHK